MLEKEIQKAKELTVAFVGNPNCGKTTLFNAFTGAKLKVANWPGVTVEKKEGNMEYKGHALKLVDLPGIYSLTSYTMEEKLSRKYILEEGVDVIVNIADASCLERNLYLTLQLIELGKPVILVLNMMDIVEERGMELDLNVLEEMLGIPVVPVSARKKTGLDRLLETITKPMLQKEESPSVQPQTREPRVIYQSTKHTQGKNVAKRYDQSTRIVYSKEIELKLERIEKQLIAMDEKIVNARWHALKILERDEDIMKQYPVAYTLEEQESLETQIINEKYDFIESMVQRVVKNKNKKVAMTDRVDQVLTNRILGVPIFLGIMGLVFFLTFTVGDFLKQYFEIGLEVLSTVMKSGLESLQVSETITSLIIDGILAGVGGILTFLPNIFILFLALAFLEDSGYMARVAYVMDGIMGKIGLSGRAFIPMLLGFGCSVPAIMASRALEDMGDRRRTILVTPFMSCSARLPIYVLFSHVFFPDHAPLVAFMMYVIGVVVAIVTALVMSQSRKKKQIHTLLIELPEYKTPNGRTIIIYVWDKVKDYLTKAGTTIFVASVIVWCLLNFGTSGLTSDMSESFGAMLGHWMIPLLAPIGLGMWQVVVALISGIAAKEVVVSSFSVLYGINNINSTAGMASFAGVLTASGFGAPNALALMTFCLLYTPCAATIGVIQRELKSTKWTVFAVCFQIIVAWIVSFGVYHIALWMQ